MMNKKGLFEEFCGEGNQDVRIFHYRTQLIKREEPIQSGEEAREAIDI